MPRIKTTRTVTVALYLLRIYLLAMLLIILTKFIIEARGRGARDAERPFRIEELSGTIESLQKQLAAMSVEGRKQLEVEANDFDKLVRSIHLVMRTV